MQQDQTDSRTGPEDRWAAPPQTPGSVASISTLATIAAVCFILYAAQDLFLPLALGMLIAFILTPVVNFLRRFGLSDTPAVILTVLAAASLVGAFVLMLGYQLSQIGANLPQYQGNVLGKIDSLLEAGEGSSVISHIQGMVADISDRLAAPPELGQAGTMRVEVVEATRIGEWITDVIIPALTPVAIFGLVFVVVIFALLERSTLRDRLVQLIGGTNILATSRLLAEAGSRVSTYLVAQLVVNVIYAIPIWLGLWLIGVPNALFFGLVTLVMRFVPYIGSAISAILPLLMAFAVSPDWSMVIWTAGLFLAVELVTSNLVEPWFYGRRTGVSPLAVIISAMFWTWLWGPMGLIIAIPLTVCLVVIGRHVPSLRIFPIMLGDAPVLSDSARLYDRLLAGQPLAFLDSATISTAKHFLAEYYDTTAIPALALAQADLQAGLLFDFQADRIARAAWTLSEELETVVEDELTLAADRDSAALVPADGTILNNGLLDGLGRRVAVLGARTRLDDVAAQMVAQAVRAEGGEALPLPHRSSLPMALRGFQPETLVLVTLDSASAQTVELQVRQLRRRLPQTRIGVALWAPPEADAPAARLGSADFRATGMADLLTQAFAVTLEAVARPAQ